MRSILVSFLLLLLTAASWSQPAPTATGACGENEGWKAYQFQDDFACCLPGELSEDQEQEPTVGTWTVLMEPYVLIVQTMDADRPIQDAADGKAFLSEFQKDLAASMEGQVLMEADLSDQYLYPVRQFALQLGDKRMQVQAALADSRLFVMLALAPHGELNDARLGTYFGSLKIRPGTGGSDPDPD